MNTSPELEFNRNEIREIMKPLQEEGVGFEVDKEKVSLILPEGTTLTPDQNEKLSTYFNTLLHTASYIDPMSAAKIATTLEAFREDPGYRKDMVEYGPSLEDDFAVQRTKRLDSVRLALTLAQLETPAGRERTGTVRTVIFTRKYLSDLGLLTIINFLRAIR